MKLLPTLVDEKHDQYGEGGGIFSFLFFKFILLGELPPYSINIKQFFGTYSWFIHKGGGGCGRF